MILFSLATPASVFAVSLGIETSQDSHQPTVQILSANGNNMDLRVHFPPNPIFLMNEGMIFDQNIYSRPAEVGVPDLPVLRKDVEFPFGSNYSVEILDSQSYVDMLGENGLPTEIPERPADLQKCDSVDDCSSASPGEEAFTNGEHSFPSSPVQLINTYIVRGRQVGQLEFWPVQFDPTSQTLVIYQELTVRIHFDQADIELTAENTAAYSSHAFDTILAPEILHFNQGQGIQTTRDLSNEGILIIAPNGFISTLSSLVNLKETQGHPVSLVSLSEIGTSPEAIRAYISNAYHNWSLPPTYVLLVGDVDNGANSMPAFAGLSTQSVTDLYYATVDGDDWIPDVFVGRLPARNTDQLNLMINNLIAYNNLSGNENWVKRAAFLASNDANFWQLAESTQNYVIDTHTGPGGYLGSFPTSNHPGGDKLYAHSYSAGKTEVENAINGGRSLIAYTGHGGRTFWSNPNFDQADVRNISQTGAFSVVTSFACVTGDYQVTESFGESWLLQPDRGAVAFIGSSGNSYWGGDDIMQRAMMDALYSGEQNANNVSSFMFAGLMGVEAVRPGTGTAQSRYYWETYNLLGDPSLKMLIEPKASDFTLSTSPSVVDICQNGESSTTITIGQVNGFNQSVTISADPNHEGIKTQLSDNPVNTPGTSTLKIQTDSNIPVGNYLIELSGQAGSLNRKVNLNLMVSGASPSAVTLNSPENLSTDIPINQTFTWDVVNTDQTYELQIALDSGFNQVVISQSNLTQPSFTPETLLDHNTTYYWRVRAANSCGASAFTNPHQFKTMPTPGQCPAGTAPTQLLQTDFETMPSGWEQYGVNESWVRSTARAYVGNYAFFSENKKTISLQHLSTPVISLPNTTGAPLTLKFWQWFEIEAGASSCFDGALLEISTDYGQSWSQIDNSKLLSTPYTGQITMSYGNPMAGKQAWCGVQDWAETLVDLSEYAGQDVQLRFTQASDDNVGLEGWYVDDVAITACVKLPDYKPQLNTPTVSVSQAPGREVVVQLQLTNAGINPDVYSLDLTSNGWLADMKNRDTIELAPGESTLVEITVTIPLDAQFGQVEQVILSVISQKDPGNPPATDSSVIELRANLQYFIPLVTTP